jgi:RHS repeat-associated protein
MEYLPGMGYYAVTRFTDKTAPLPKNRVGVFSASARVRAKLIPSQPLELQLENRPTRTETASGVRYYGHRFYHPELGWISRDPIEERGGLNIYVFVGNDPVSVVDPDGLAEYDFVPDPVRNCSYTYKNLGYMTYSGRLHKILGQVDKNHFEVVCSCDCADNGGYEMYCKLYMWVDLFLDSGYEGRSSYLGGPKRGVYGHEQKHITSMQSLVLNDLMPALNQWEALGSTRSLERCNKWAKSVKEMGENRLDRYWRSEARHANPGSPGRYDDVEPIEGLMP